MSKKLKKTIIVGITGQLATGKSSVAAMFAEHGAGVINADLLAHRALRPHGKCFKDIVAMFGDKIIDPNTGEINRAQLAEIVFLDAKLLRKLEGIIHPFVIKEARRQIRVFKKNRKDVIVLDVPLLFESGMNQLADYTIAVKASRVEQFKRVAKEGRMSRSEALRRMRSQLSMSDKSKRADIIVNNGGALEKTRKQVHDIIEMLKRRY